MAPDVIVSTSGYTDREFHLPAGKSFPVFFAFRREFSYKPRRVRLFVELPAGFVCTGYGLEMKRLKDQNGAWDASAAKYLELYRGICGEAPLRDPSEPAD